MTDHSHTKKYFHDRLVLLMLTVNVFLTFVCIAAILFQLGNTGNSYIQSYRSNLGLNAYSVGGVTGILSFAFYAVMVLIGQFYFSLRLHPVRRNISLIIMILGMLLIILSLIVSNSLLKLR